MKFRTPSIEEYERILELWDEAGLPYKPEGRDTREKIEKELREKPEYWIGAYEEGELIALIVGTDDGRKGWINRFAVDPDYQDKGIGTELLKRMEKEFESKGFEVIGALIEGDNPGSMEFFERRGYEDLGIKYYSKRKSQKS
ncbi:MAG: GNAT family N-acetyltransferase [Thermoplasmata archaeon]